VGTAEGGGRGLSHLGAAKQGMHPFQRLGADDSFLYHCLGLAPVI
jgi:hypothetical protein